jgi:signal transduction histidine kinase
MAYARGEDLAKDVYQNGAVQPTRACRAEHSKALCGTRAGWTKPQDGCWREERMPNEGIKDVQSATADGELRRVAHDARNMMTALALYSELLAEPGVLTPPHAHFARELSLLASTGIGLMEQLAGERASRTCGCGSPERCPGEGEDLARAAGALLDLLNVLAGPRVVVEIESRPPGGATRLKAEQLTRILVNLVLNASEAMGDGGTIRITLQPAESLDGKVERVLLCVRDTGPGIPPERLDRIFEAGYSRGKRGGHRGLGLAIVKELVESAGGSITCQSSAVTGTCFEIELPLLRKFALPGGLITDPGEGRCLQC